MFGNVHPRKSASHLISLILFLALAGGAKVSCQVFDFAKDRIAAQELHGYWRFHIGDNARWSDPSFDDSYWLLLRSDQSWSDQGFKNYGGIAWYRFEVKLPAVHPPLGLYVPELPTSYQVFANGALIGQLGGLPPDGEDVTGGYAKGRQIIPIPDEIVSQDGTVTIAIRVWHWEHRAFSPGGPLTEIMIGDIDWLERWRSLQFKEAFWSISADNVLLLGYILAGIAGFGLVALQTRDREYLWFAAFSLAAAGLCATVIYPEFSLSKWQHYHAIQGALVFGRLMCFSMFLVSLLKEPRGRLFWIAITTLSIACLTYVPGVMTWISVSTWLLIATPAALCPLISLQLLIYGAAKRGNPDARLLLAPFAFWSGAEIAETVITLLYTSGHLRYSFFRAIRELVSRPFPISLTVSAEFAMQLSLLVILVLRFSRTRRDEQRMLMELESARMVQSVLIPTEIPSIPMVQISAVYRPASQVGGDLFQIIRTSQGGVLAVIGDVSGKGMPAAMTVSLLVGTIRTLAHYTQSPTEILSAMNQRMLARSGGGFTTCLALRIDPDGTTTIANAGHLAPFLNGCELQLQNGLPLGLTAATICPESTFHLNFGDRLTLVTDGVVEARNKKGELYGFVRAAAIASCTAMEIAESAQGFGQEDDITVVTVVRTEAAERVNSLAALSLRE